MFWVLRTEILLVPVFKRAFQNAFHRCFAPPTFKTEDPHELSPRLYQVSIGRNLCRRFGVDTVCDLLNVSYDPTRELYVEFNQAFAKHWKAKTGQDVTIKQSHGGSGKQARSIIDGLDADVATLALAGDTDALHTNGGWIPKDWQKRLPHNSSPYTSTIVLVVRQGNPKGIKDWDDLVKPGVSVITPNPKTSGGARWNYLAAWEFAKRKYGSDAKAKDFVAKLYANVPVLDTGARGSTITFAQRNQGDVLIAWENEAYLLEKEFGAKFDVIAPSMSILAEPAVTVVDKNVDKKGTRAVAEAYLKYLYTEEGQDIAGKHFYRPAVSTKAKAKYAKQFPKLNLFTIDDAFGGWDKAAKDHFADNASFRPDLHQRRAAGRVRGSCPPGRRAPRGGLRGAPPIRPPARARSAPRRRPRGVAPAPAPVAACRQFRRAVPAASSPARPWGSRTSRHESAVRPRGPRVGGCSRPVLVRPCSGWRYS
jgi:sulfate/thiosulfate-binding protein